MLSTSSEVNVNNWSNQVGRTGLRLSDKIRRPKGNWKLIFKFRIGFIVCVSSILNWSKQLKNSFGNSIREELSLIQNEF